MLFSPLFLQGTIVIGPHGWSEWSEWSGWAKWLIELAREWADLWVSKEQPASEEQGWPTDLPAYWPASLPTYHLSTYRPWNCRQVWSCLDWSCLILIKSLSCTPTDLPTYRSTHLPTYPSTNLPTYRMNERASGWMKQWNYINFIGYFLLKHVLENTPISLLKLYKFHWVLPVETCAWNHTNYIVEHEIARFSSMKFHKFQAFPNLQFLWSNDYKE